MGMSAPGTAGVRWHVHIQSVVPGAVGIGLVGIGFAMVPRALGGPSCTVVRRDVRMSAAAAGVAPSTAPARAASRRATGQVAVTGRRPVRSRPVLRAEPGYRTPPFAH
jgi:threonine dehydrogenase-like Zn-dependent dehydrogenase